MAHGSQLQDQVRPAAHGGLRARVRTLDGKVAPLDKIAAHRAHDGRLFAKAPPQFVNLPLMAAVKRIILGYYTNRIHKSPLKAVTKELHFVKFTLCLPKSLL